MKMEEPRDLFPGALEMMVLRTLERQSMHGYALVQHIKRTSDDLLQVEEGSLYPALQRLRLQGWLDAEWAETPLGRRARFYRLTAAGKKQLGIEVSEFQQLIAAISRVMRTT